MKICSRAEIVKMEEEAMANGISQDMLMENAGFSLLDVVTKHCHIGYKIVVVAGSGNNGGDALVVARLLWLRGFSVSALVCGETSPLTKSKLLAYEFVGGRIAERSDIKMADLIIDGIFGSGLNREVGGVESEIIAEINASSAIVVAIDLPSGIACDSGKVLGKAVRADITVTFDCYKFCHFFESGADYSGKIEVRRIGLPQNSGYDIIGNIELRRAVASHKGSYGNIAIVGGSGDMVGAVKISYLSAVSAMRSGAGKVTLCVPASLKMAYQMLSKENMLFGMYDLGGSLAYAESDLNKLMGYDCIAFGMGLGKCADARRMLAYLLANFSGNLIVDADGLNALAEDKSILVGHNCEVFLTPHVGEWRRLCGNEYNASDYHEVERFCRDYSVNVAVKSNVTFVSNGRESALNITGCPAMAKGGSGDALAGMLSALSIVLPPFEAMKKAVYEFGKAGERAELRCGESATLATDIIDEIKF